MRPCTCERVRTGQPYDATQCRLCWLYHNRPDYRRLWNGVDGKEATQVSKVSRPACTHLGMATGETEHCGTCRGRMRLKLFGCVKHGTCTLQQPLSGTACCSTCPDYAPHPTQEVTNWRRNLLYHLYPVKGSFWRERVKALLQRRHLFDARRIIAIVTDDRTDRAVEVEKAFGSFPTDLIVKANDPALQEVQTFQDLFEKNLSLDPDEVTLWCHGKGVTHGHNKPSATWWAETLEELYLDKWHVVEGLLRQYPIVGAFKKVGIGFVECKESLWHYSGSWFWFKNRDHYSRDWQTIGHFPYAIEAYPGMHYTASEAGCIFYDTFVGHLDLYKHHEWQQKVFPALARWRSEVRQARRNPMLNIPNLRVLAGPASPTDTKILAMGRMAFEQRGLRAPSVLISMIDPHNTPVYVHPPALLKDMLRLQFQDMDEGEHAPTVSHAQQIAAIIQRWQGKVEEIIFQCEAGVGRSVAAAGATLRVMGKELEAQAVLSKTPHNRLLYRLLLDAYGRSDLMYQEPLISICIRVKYPPDRLMLMLLCLQRQRHRNWEALVVTDGPDQDGKIKAVLNYLQDPRIVLWETPESRGHWGHPYRAEAIQRCRGEWIGLTNDDNYYTPGYLEQMVCCGINEGAELVLCDMLHNYWSWSVIKGATEIGHCDVGNWIGLASLVKGTPWIGLTPTADGEFVLAMARKAKRVGFVPRPLFVHS